MKYGDYDNYDESRTVYRRMMALRSLQSHEWRQLPAVWTGTQAQRHILIQYRREASSRPTIHKWHRTFMETGSVLRQKGSGRRNTSVEDIERVQSAFVRSPNKSIRSTARELNLPHWTVHKVLHKNLRLFAYKVQSLMLAGNEFQSLGRAIVKEDEYEEVRWDGIVSIVSWRERVFRFWWEESWITPSVTSLHLNVVSRCLVGIDIRFILHVASKWLRELPSHFSRRFKNLFSSAFRFEGPTLLPEKWQEIIASNNCINASQFLIRYRIVRFADFLFMIIHIFISVKK
ncbi:hypothetical protein ANN_02585 [Periplaneta americana]|uniref:DUF4817 domain-containing protein n=1 Tax=Periplaneta americana TaxID=6978 RepID=A0ABQ8TZ80_PERAM|nr:hypothetical protein ANN_02585 [Periplaneta americana]